MVEESAQINTSVMDNSKKINSLRLELEQVKENLNSKNHEIECIEKEIKAIHEITSQKIDALSSA